MAAAGFTMLFAVRRPRLRGVALVFAVVCLSAFSSRRATAQACVGDCDRSGAVTVDELVAGINVALGEAPVEQCRALDANADQRVSVDELVSAVNLALTGCAIVTPTLEVTATPTPASVLTLIEVDRDGLAGATRVGPTSVVLSPDGRYLYVAGFDNAVPIFRRDSTTGSLTLVNVENGTGFSSERIVISPDGAYAYAAGYGGGGDVAMFGRDQATGRLTLLEVFPGKAPDLTGARSLAITNDGVHLYVASHGSTVTGFERDPTTGRLTLIEEQAPQSYDGFRFGWDLALSPDGANVYVVSFVFDRIAVFGHDALSGRLTFLEQHENGADGVTGLARPWTVVVSPDGRHVYVAATKFRALSTFERENTSGRLRFLRARFGFATNVVGLAVSPDGTLLYAGGGNGGALLVFRREAVTGNLRLAEQHKDAGGLSFLQVTASEDGKYVYVVGNRLQRENSAIVVFRVNHGGTRRR